MHESLFVTLGNLRFGDQESNLLCLNRRHNHSAPDGVRALRSEKRREGHRCTGKLATFRYAMRETKREVSL